MSHAQVKCRELASLLSGPSRDAYERVCRRYAGRYTAAVNRELGAGDLDTAALWAQLNVFREARGHASSGACFKFLLDEFVKEMTK